MTKSSQFLYVFIVLLITQTTLSGMTAESKQEDSVSQSIKKAGAEENPEEQKKILLSHEDQFLIVGYLKRVSGCTKAEELDGLLYDLMHDQKLNMPRDGIDESGDRQKLIINTVADMLRKSNINLTMLRGTDQATVLHCAAARGDCTVVEIVCLAGANTSARDAFGETAMHYAAYKGTNDERNAEVCMLLGSKFEASVCVMNTNQETPLHRAAEFKKAHCCRVLIDLGSIKGFLNEQWQTAFFQAATNRDPTLCALFINAGYDWTAVDKTGKSVRDYAPKIIDKLVWEKRKADLVWVLSGMLQTMLSLFEKPEEGVVEATGDQKEDGPIS